MGERGPGRRRRFVTGAVVVGLLVSTLALLAPATAGAQQGEPDDCPGSAQQLYDLGIDAATPDRVDRCRLLTCAAVFSVSVHFGASAIVVVAADLALPPTGTARDLVLADLEDAISILEAWCEGPLPGAGCSVDVVPATRNRGGTLTANDVADSEVRGGFLRFRFVGCENELAAAACPTLDEIASVTTEPDPQRVERCGTTFTCRFGGEVTVTAAEVPSALAAIDTWCQWQLLTPEILEEGDCNGVVVYQPETFEVVTQAELSALPPETVLALGRVGCDDAAADDSGGREEEGPGALPVVGGPDTLQQPASGAGGSGALAASGADDGTPWLVLAGATVLLAGAVLVIEARRARRST